MNNNKSCNNNYSNHNLVRVLLVWEKLVGVENDDNNITINIIIIGQTGEFCVLESAMQGRPIRLF